MLKTQNTTSTKLPSEIEYLGELTKAKMNIEATLQYILESNYARDEKDEEYRQKLAQFFPILQTFNRAADALG